MQIATYKYTQKHKFDQKNNLFDSRKYTPVIVYKRTNDIHV